MNGDRDRVPGRRSGNAAAAAAAVQLAPGKRTLTEQLVPLERPHGADGVTAVTAQGAEFHQVAAHGVAGSTTAMPHRETIQRLFGRHDVSHIAAHTDAGARGASAAIGAEAYASGGHVAFASEAPSLHTAAHEAAHVVQQRGGVQLKGGVGQAGDAYEQHADAVAARVTRGESAEPLLDAFAGPAGTLAGSEAPNAAAVQLKKVGFALYGIEGPGAKEEEKEYVKEENRKDYELTIAGGQVSYKTPGGASDTRQWVDGSGRIQYVYSDKLIFYGKYFAADEKEGTHDFHSKYTAAGNVICAGWMHVEGHRITKVGNDSGHYKPEMEGMYKMLQILVKTGVDMAVVTVRYVTPADDGSKEGKEATSTGTEFLATHGEAYENGQHLASERKKQYSVSAIDFSRPRKSPQPSKDVNDNAKPQIPGEF
jgi:hypothetical protein